MTNDRCRMGQQSRLIRAGMNKLLAVASFFVLLQGSGFASFAQDAQAVEAGQSPEASGRAAPYYRYFDFKPAPKIFGAKADALVGFRLFDGVDTALWARAEGAYKLSDYYRAADLSLYRQDLYPGIDYSRTALKKLIALWGLGVQQGLHFNPVTDRDDLTLLVSWRGAWTDPIMASADDSLLAIGNDPYGGRLLIQSFQADLQYDATVVDSSTKVRSGWALDASAEYAPPGLSVPASTDYAQYDVSVKGFLPLFEKADERGWNVLSFYLAGFTGVDYIAALGTDATKGVPYTVSQRFGGRVYQDGLGGAVRGLGDGWADGTFKAVGNLELRCNFPALFRKDILVGSTIFTDAGYYADPPGAPSGSELNSGACVSAGLGFFMDVLDQGYVAFYTTLLLNTTNYRNEYWEPLSLEFGLHF
jgi:hypothetical protein